MHRFRSVKWLQRCVIS